MFENTTIAGDWLSREKLAGYDPATLSTRVVVVGAGAAGNNIVQTLALSGCTDIAIIDYDTIEPSNLTRSPLFRPERMQGSRRRFKAREVALSAVEVSYAEDFKARYAIAPVEALGLGAFEGAGVVIAAVDSLSLRAFLADATRLLGIPLVEVGFLAPNGQVSVFPNRTTGEPCWRCLHPEVQHGSASCALYAEAAIAAGIAPATQTVAAVFGSLAAEAAIMALHGEFPLGGKVLHLDIRTGKSTVLELVADPQCPGGHRLLGEVQPLSVTTNDSAQLLLAAASGHGIADPVLRLPLPFMVEAPCVACGSRVSIQRPVWTLSSPPRCKACKTERSSEPVLPVITSRVARSDRIAQLQCKRLGLSSGAVFEIEDAATRKSQAFHLAGGPDDLFITKTRNARNNLAPQAITVSRDDEEFEPLVTVDPA